MAPNVGRVDRGFSRGGEPPFTPDQRIYLLERDMDDADVSDAAFRKEVRDELIAIRRLVTNRLNMIVGIGFTLLVAVVSVLVTVIANGR